MGTASYLHYSKNKWMETALGNTLLSSTTAPTTHMLDFSPLR